MGSAGCVVHDHERLCGKDTKGIIHVKPPRTSSEPLRRALGWTTLEVKTI